MSDDHSLPAKTTSNRSVELHGSGMRAGSLLDFSLKNLSKEQQENLVAKAGEEALRLQVKNAEMEMDYLHGKKQMQDHVDVFNMLERDGKTTRQSVASEIKTGAGTMRIESKSGICFVATATYGNADHPDVCFLRNFRDKILIKTKAGKIFIDWYYQNGPKIAFLIYNSNILKCWSRLLIQVIIYMLKFKYKKF